MGRQGLSRKFVVEIQKKKTIEIPALSQRVGILFKTGRNCHFFSWQFSWNLVFRICILPDLNVAHESSPKEDEQAIENGTLATIFKCLFIFFKEGSWISFKSDITRILQTKLQENFHEKK